MCVDNTDCGCGCNEVISKRGLPGPRGVQGPAGPQGVQGPQGPAGAADIFIEVILEEAFDLINAEELIVGATYSITDRGIFLQALANNLLASTGERVMRIVKNVYYTPATGVLGVWNNTLTPSAGNVAIWGGKVWTNLTGVVGTATDDTALDATNWVLVPTTNNTYYFTKSFGCTYDMTNDWVASQWDDNGNFYTMGHDLAVFLGLSFNPIDITDYGKSSITNNNCGGIFNNVAAAIYKNYVTIIRECNADVIGGNDVNREMSRIVCSGNLAGNQGSFIKDVSGVTDFVENRFSEIENLSINGSLRNNICQDIKNCDNNGHIRFNRIAGSIDGIGSANDNIEYNINNGDITTTTTGDISDTVVNK